MSDNVRFPNKPTHAVNFKDNWDGEGDKYFVFAFMHEGKLHSFENGRPLIQFEGDEILAVWELNSESSVSGKRKEEICETI